MKSEQLADNVTLWCGDCRQIIPTLTGIDAVISDPPYGIQDIVGGYSRTGETIANDTNLKVVGEAFTLARKIITPNAWIAAFYSCRITPIFFKMMEASGYKDADYFGEMLWDKRAPGMGSQIRYQHENVAVYRIGKPDQMKDCMSVINFAALRGEARSDGSTHPHEKPHQVMVNVVSAIPGKMILDPFMGTGSTGAAAVQIKRGFVGVELEPRYFEIAVKKISKALSQPVAFWE